MNVELRARRQRLRERRDNCSDLNSLSDYADRINRPLALPEFRTRTVTEVVCPGFALGRVMVPPGDTVVGGVVLRS